MKNHKLVWIAGSVVLLAVGVIVIPKLLKKVTATVYKTVRPGIDFDSIGPEIVKKENNEEQENGN